MSRKANVEADAAGQGSRVARHYDLAIRIRRDGGQSDAAKGEFHAQVSEREIILDAFLELHVLLTLAQIHDRLRRRKRVAREC